MLCSVHSSRMNCCPPAKPCIKPKLCACTFLQLRCFLGHALHALTAAAVVNRPGAGGEEQREVFESALKSVDATFQNLDSSEISLTDVSHYFDSDPTKLVSGLRGDGKLPSSYIADTTTANAQVGHS